MSKFVLGDTSLIGVVVYGWSSSPSWPSARKATAAALSQITREIVLGLQGPRFICGDMNGEDAQLPEFAVWESMGWVELQTLNHHRCHKPPCNTYRGKTRPDRMYLSPELAAHFVSASVEPAFADHDALIGHFDLPWTLESGIRWPMTAKIPWGLVDLPRWTSSPAASPPAFDSCADSTAWYRSFGQAYERSFDGYLTSPTSGKLPAGCQGRGQFLDAQPFTPHPPSVRASRDGEETMAPGFVNQQVVRWFKQLRRIQALVQNCRAASSLATAVEFRLQTWHSILRARGFQMSFVDWWAVRPYKLQGVIECIPQCLPRLTELEDIYTDFRVNYRAFEAWNLRNRREVLKVAVQESARLAFQRVVGKTQVSMDFLTHCQKATLTSVAAGTFEVTTDVDVQVSTDCVCKLDDVPAIVRRVGAACYVIDSDLLLCPGQELSVFTHYTSTEEKLAAVLDFWTTRWQRHAAVPPEQWSRIMQFVSAHLTPLPFSLPPLSVSVWDRAVARFAPRAARGPDSYDRLDLIRMPSSFRHALVDLLTRIEAGTPWPQQLCLGRGHCLPKHAAASEVGTFLSRMYSGL